MFSKAESITMKLDGVHDAATRKAAALAIRGIDGVRSVTMKNDAANVSFYPSKTTVSALTNALELAGFSVI